MKALNVAALLLMLGSVSACDEDQQACNDIAGNGHYTPRTEDGSVYCENAWNGDRFLLRDE